MRALTGISDKIHLFLDAIVSAKRFLGRASHNSVLLLQPGEQTHYHWPLWEGCAKDSTIPWLRAKTNEMQTIYPKDFWQFCIFHNSLSGIVSWFDQISNNNKTVGPEIESMRWWTLFTCALVTRARRGICLSGVEINGDDEHLSQSLGKQIFVDDLKIISDGLLMMMIMIIIIIIFLMILMILIHYIYIYI